MGTLRSRRKVCGRNNMRELLGAQELVENKKS